jgi:hypothetical protein
MLLVKLLQRRWARSIDPDGGPDEFGNGHQATEIDSLLPGWRTPWAVVAFLRAVGGSGATGVPEESKQSATCLDWCEERRGCAWEGRG